MEEVTARTGWPEAVGRRVLGVSPDLVPQAQFLAPLLGVWRGEGRGLWPADPPLAYREQVTVSATPKPFLVYAQQTWALDDGRPMHSEVGYLRAVGEDRVELVLAQPTGFVETHAGRFAGGRLDLGPLTVTPTPTALPVTTVERRITVTGDRWEYLLRLGMNGEPATDHLRAELRRVPDGA